MKALYEPALRRAIRNPLTFITGAVVLLIVAGLLFTRLGQEFVPTLDEKNIAMNALRIPSTSLSQSQAMQLMVEKADPQISAGRGRVFENGHGRSGDGSDASQYFGHIHHAEAAGGMAGPAFDQGRAAAADRRGRGSFGRQCL